MKLTPAQRDQIAADAVARYRAGESWQQIAESHGVTGEHVRRLTVARHDITYRRWGRRPVADVDEVVRRRDESQTLDQIAGELECSRQAIRTALQAAHRGRATRYPRLSERREPTEDEILELRGLYEACVKGHWDLPVGGQLVSLSADSSSPCWRSVDLPGG